MLLSYNWLSQYIDISSCGPDELAEKMTMAGIEVEAIERTELIPAGIVVGKILERKPHPDAEKLSVCRVFDGKEELQVVCGAPNCDAGKTVPLATIGTTFVDPKDGSEFKIKKSKLRGVESCGMMCSSSELGLDGDHSGLLELSDTLQAGTPLSHVFRGDTVYEVEITPNRPDWLSHWGIARDVACLLRKEAHLPQIAVTAPVKKENAQGLVMVESPDLCPRYTARIIRNVTIKESPEWLKERLLSVGLRPINNVVDITNFVLFELGHPLHAFDLDLLSGKRIVVRRARSGEKMTTLDGRNLELQERHLVIADAEKPMALAGVMGGLDSGVSEKTVNVLLESATFFTSNIRSTSRELGISSDSSYRFERGTDWEMVQVASDRAIQLILELAGGELVTDLVDVNSGRPVRNKVICRFDRIRGLVGAEISDNEIMDTLKKLRLEVTEVSADRCYVVPPLFRHDIEREADLAEEIARIYGLDSIPVAPVQAVAPGMMSDDTFLIKEQLRSRLIGLGLYECMHYSMVSEASALQDAAFLASDLVKIGNPLSLELAFMRPSLFGEVMATVERNISRQNTDLRLFEYGRVFCANKDKYPEERDELCIVLSGKRHPELYSAALAEEYDFYDLKGMVESLLEMYRFNYVQFRKAQDGKFDYCAEVLVNGKVIGVLGKVAGRLTKGLKTKSAVFAAVIQVDAMLQLKAPKMLFEAIPQYPSTTRDVAFVAPETLQHSEVTEFIGRSKLKFLEKVELFDIFRDDSLGAGRKSMAYKLTFRNSERTLTDEEVNAAFDKLRVRLASELKVELR